MFKTSTWLDTILSYFKKNQINHLTYLERADCDQYFVIEIMNIRIYRNILDM